VIRRDGIFSVTRILSADSPTASFLEAVEHVHEKILGSKLPSYANFASDTDTASNKTYDLIQEINNCMSLLKDTYDPVLNTPALKMFLNNLEIDQIKGALKLVP
jgi:hypothetical protein